MFLSWVHNCRYHESINDDNIPLNPDTRAVLKFCRQILYCNGTHVHRVICYNAKPPSRSPVSVVFNRVRCHHHLWNLQQCTCSSAIVFLLIWRRMELPKTASSITHTPILTLINADIISFISNDVEQLDMCARAFPDWHHLISVFHRLEP